MGGLFSSPKPPTVKVPPPPSAEETLNEVKKKEQVKSLSLIRYLSGSNQTGLDVLRGTYASKTGLNI